MEKLNLSLLLLIVGIGCFTTRTVADNIKLALKNFQINFLSAMDEIVEREANIYIDEFLNDFVSQAKYEIYEKEAIATKQAKHLASKIVFVKQLIDVASPNLTTDEHFYLMRNLIFFKKVKKYLKNLEGESLSEFRHERMYRTCLPLHDQRPNQTSSRYTKILPPYKIQKMAAFISNSSSNTNSNQRQNNSFAVFWGEEDNQTVKIDVLEFGRALYREVKAEGAEIIDDYLRSVRQVLEEVIEEADENDQHCDKLFKVLSEINLILKIDDFYEKRQTIYKYLEHGLLDDSEQVDVSDFTKQSIFEVSTRLKAKGLDLFVAFIFSNFEFLDYAHTKWSEMLPTNPLHFHDDNSQLLYNVSHFYKVFKAEHVSEGKYNNYLKYIENLYEKTPELQQSTDARHLFDLVNSASKNLGPITLNIIKTKCAEF